MVSAHTEKGEAMSRYIDADAFEYQLKEIEAITAMVDKNLGEDEEVGEISMPMFTIRNIMRKCVPIDIVRCKECRYLEVHGKTTKYYWCDQWEHYTDEQDFCSSGEREGE